MNTNIPCRTAPASTVAERKTPGVKSVSTFRPPVDVIEEPTEFRIVADVPGASPQDIEIEYEAGTLTMTARVTPRTIGENVQPLVQEYGVGDYRRTFRISDAVDPAAATADYTEGVLTVRLPKTEQARRRKIDVKIN